MPRNFTLCVQQPLAPSTRFPVRDFALVYVHTHTYIFEELRFSTYTCTLIAGEEVPRDFTLCLQLPLAPSARFPIRDFARTQKQAHTRTF